MALDYSLISTTAFARLNLVDARKYRSASNLVSAAKGLFQVNAKTVVKDNNLPLDKTKYKDANAFWTKFNSLIDAEYKIFRHNSSVVYAAIPYFESLGRDFLVKSVGMLGVIGDMQVHGADPDRDKYFIAANGPFFTGLGFVIGPVCINNVMDSTNASNGGNGFIKVEHPSTSNSDISTVVMGQGDTNNTPVNTGEFVDGFSSLPPLITNSVYKAGYDANLKTSTTNAKATPHLGAEIFAYKPTITGLLYTASTVFVIMKANAQGKDKWDIDTIRECLLFLGFSNAYFMDGSDSVYMWDYAGPGNGSPVITSLAGNGGKNSLFDYYYLLKRG